MRQIDRFIERTSRPPTVVMRVFSGVMSIVLVMQALVSHRLEDILVAVLVVVLILPSAIAPETMRRRSAALEERRPILGAVFMFVLVAVGGFIILRWFLDRFDSALVAGLLALTLTLVAAVLRRTRTPADG